MKKIGMRTQAMIIIVRLYQIKRPTVVFGRSVYTAIQAGNEPRP